MSKSSIFKRSKSLLLMATKVAAKETGLKLTEALKKASEHEFAKKITRIEQAKTITKNLAELKGAAMKAGQLLSLDASQLLPEEAIDILSHLQNMAEPENFEVIKKVLKSELAEKLDLIKNINPKPLAAASIGQVHRAEFKDQKIVLKIQYPDVEKSIDSDLKILEKLTELFLLSTLKKIDLKETFGELARVLKLETDYENEINILDFVHKKLRGNNFFYAPQAYPEISTRKVLAMEYIPGKTLHEWIKTKPNMEKKQKIGKEILKLFLEEFLDWNIVQTDPNFGNFLIQESPFKMILLDFGSTLKYDKKFIQDYLNILYITSRRKKEECFAEAVRFGLLNKKEPEEVQSLFYKMMQVSMEPFLSKEQPFDFSDTDYEKRNREIVLQFTKSLKYSAPPRKILFLHRKLGGLFALLKKMEVKIDISLFWSELMDKKDKV